MEQIKLLLFQFLVSFIIFGMAYGKIIYCYVGTWSYYRTGDGKFTNEDIDPKLCTHLGYSFFGLSPNGEVKHLDSYLDKDLGLINKTIGLKYDNPELKVMAVVGGWNEGSGKYSQMAADPQKRKLFIDSLKNLVTTYRFDGAELDWEYPGKREGSSPQDKEHFVTLLREMFADFKKMGLLLTIAVGASEETARISYDIANIVKYVDFVNIMSYDYATADEGTVGYNSPLRGQGNRNAVSSIKYWVKNGAPESKLVLGLAFYGRTFRLANSNQFKLGSQTIGAGNAGPITQQSGFLGYNEICPKERDTSVWSQDWIEESSVPTLRSSNELISYDNVKSIEEKVDFAIASNLAGVMIWSIETDDFHGKCYGTKYPLLTAVNNKLGKNNHISSKPFTPVNHRNQNGYPKNSISSKPFVPVNDRKQNAYPKNSISSKPFKSVNPSACTVDGFYRDESNCNIFYRCVNKISYQFSCPSNLYFDPSISSCNTANLVPCNNDI